MLTLMQEAGSARNCDVEGVAERVRVRVCVPLGVVVAVGVGEVEGEGEVKGDSLGSGKAAGVGVALGEPEGVGDSETTALLLGEPVGVDVPDADGRPDAASDSEGEGVPDADGRPDTTEAEGVPDGEGVPLLEGTERTDVGEDVCDPLAVAESVSLLLETVSMNDGAGEMAAPALLKKMKRVDDGDGDAESDSVCVSKGDDVTAAIWASGKGASEGIEVIIAGVEREPSAERAAKAPAMTALTATRRKRMALSEL
jgi:hypothetical protein